MFHLCNSVYFIVVYCAELRAKHLATIVKKKNETLTGHF